MTAKRVEELRARTSEGGVFADDAVGALHDERTRGCSSPVWLVE